METNIELTDEQFKKLVKVLIGSKESLKLYAFIEITDEDTTISEIHYLENDNIDDIKKIIGDALILGRRFLCKNEFDELGYFEYKTNNTGFTIYNIAEDEDDEWEQTIKNTIFELLINM